MESNDPKFYRRLGNAFKDMAAERLTRNLNPNGPVTSVIFEKAFWWLNFGETIIVNWPRGQDVNDAWRKWLEDNVGRQGHDWDWRVHYPKNLANGFQIEIKFRRKIYASQFLLVFMGDLIV